LTLILFSAIRDKTRGEVKKVFFFAAFLIAAVSLFSQQISEETFVVNVEVPVRVFKGSQFIDNLSINDFEIFENGIPQKIEAVYLVKKKSIERREEKRRFSPITSRDFYLFFEISEYTSKIGEAVNYFVQNVASPDDTLTIISPMQTYRLKSRTFEILSKDRVVNQLKGILRKDALVGGSEYRDTIEDMTQLARSLSSSIQSRREGTTESATTSTAELYQPQTVTRNLDEFTRSAYENLTLDEQLTRYVDLLNRLDNIRQIEYQKFLEFANILKNKEGQKYVFVFYEREFIPKVEPKILNQYLSLYEDRPNVLHTVTGIFDFYRREMNIDVNQLKKAYADSSVSIHFLFITTPATHIYGVKMEEQSEDIYVAFNEMAQATGGFSDSSANSASLFKKALNASENYYLLYYSPESYKKDGSFRQIKVKVKNGDYRIAHRAGYFAD
jgi:VWFA-related protein